MLRRLNAISLYARRVSMGKAKTYLKYGLALVPGDRSGVYISDLNGKKFMNFHCNGGVFNFGHNCPETVAALRDALANYDIGSELACSALRERLSEKLASLMPGDISDILLCATGSEANDAAIKAAYIHTGRSGIVSANGGYHGGSGLSVTAGDPAFKAPFGPELPGFQQIPFGDSKAMEAAVGQNTAAVILETIPATLGMKMPPDDYFRSVREICDRRGALLIIDEVQTGLGRTGKLWAIEHWGIEPDIIVVGKGLSGGVYPIAAACFHQKLAPAFKADPFFHRSEFGGADPGCAVAIKTLEICSSTEFLDHVNIMSDYFQKALTDLINEFPETIDEIRQKGLFMAIVFKDDISSLLALKLLFGNGLYTVYAGNDKKVLQFLPPLNITTEEADRAMKIVKKSLSALNGPAAKVLMKVLSAAGLKTV